MPANDLGSLAEPWPIGKPLACRCVFGQTPDSNPIFVTHCWTQARRNLKEIFDRDGYKIAVKGLRRIAKFYAIEKDIRGTSPANACLRVKR